MSLSENIRNYRLKKDLTQEQLAAVLGVSAQAVSKWETSDTYPDGTLLVPLANALGVSLDRLFGNKIYDMSELSDSIEGIISSFPKEERFNCIRDICWQIQKGLHGSPAGHLYSYSPGEYKSVTDASACVSDYGFTHICNGKAPFFSVFPENDDCYSEVIGDGEEIRKIFSMLAKPETMRAALFILRKDYDLLFDVDFLAKECEITDEMTGAVIEDLLCLKIIRKTELEIDGVLTVLYFSNPRYQLLALLLMATQVKYNGGYCRYVDNRTKPFLK